MKHLENSKEDILSVSSSAHAHKNNIINYEELITTKRFKNSF